MSAIALKNTAVFSPYKKTMRKIRRKAGAAAEEKELLSALKHIERQLNFLHNQFDNVTDPALIEACVYEIKAAHAKYTYYLKKAKEKHITVQGEFF